MKVLWSALVMFVFSVSIQAQITITNASLPNIGDTVRYSIANINSVGDYTSTGTNYVWHFDTLKVIGQDRRDFTNNTPYPFFSGPGKFGEKIADTIVSQNIPGFGSVSITDFYQFYRNLPTVFEVEGAGVKINSMPVPSFYLDSDELYLLPLYYGKRDSTTFKFSTATSTAIPIVYKKSGYRITEVDGWGTITTPYGTFNCLRVVTTQYSKDTIIFNSTFGSIPFGFNNYQRSYQWLSNTEKIPILEVSGNINNMGNFIPNMVRFRDNYRVVSVNEISEKSEHLNVYPNPASNVIKIPNIFRNSSVQIQIYNALGQLVFSLNEQNDFSDNIEIDISHLPNGRYFGKVIDVRNVFRFDVVVNK
ncbi:MAG: hypothetical protein OHK0036_18710 [Bacteroidia bacterium]